MAITLPRTLTLVSSAIVAASAAFTAFAAPASAVTADLEAAPQLAASVAVGDGTIHRDGRTALVAVTYLCEAGSTQTITIDLSGGFNNGSGSKVVECTGAAVDDAVTVTAYDAFTAQRVYAFASMTDGSASRRLISLHY